jgi:hypothetical protein
MNCTCNDECGMITYTRGSITLVEGDKLYDLGDKGITDNGRWMDIGTRGHKKRCEDLDS